MPIGDNSICHPLIYPFNITSTPGSGTLALSSATTFIAFSVLVRAAVTFTKFRFYGSGTGTVNSVTVELQADNGSGSPSGTALDTGTITSYGNTAAWRECNNFTGNQTLTPGATYWIVIKNTSTTPASNYPTVTFAYGMLPPWVNTDSSQVRHYKKSTTDGSTWASAVGTCVAYMAGFADGSWYGVPGYAGGYFNTAGVDRAYTGVELGGVGVTPDEAWLNVVGIWGWIRRVGSPGALRLKIYAGTSLLCQSMDIPQAQTSVSAAAISGLFDKVITVSPRTLIRAMITAEGGDNASNYYYLSGQFCDADYPQNAPSLVTYTRIDGGVATDTAGKHPAIALLLDAKQPFAVPPINRRQFNSMR